jgi:uncharacterized protein
VREREFISLLSRAEHHGQDRIISTASGTYWHRPISVLDGSASSFIRKVTRPFRIAWVMPWYFKLLRVLISPEIRAIVRRDWRTILIPLRSYLSIVLRRKNRIKVMTHHYTYLRDNLDDDFLARICRTPVPLWKEEAKGVSYQIVISVPPSVSGQNREGDLSLLFQADSTSIFTLSFTICPGAPFKLAADDAMYIGRLQGARDRMDLIKTSTKNCRDTSPQVLLLAVAQGIATAMNLKHMVCIAYEGKALAQQDELCNVKSIYDEFWVAMGATKLGDHAYHMPIPTPRKPLESIGQHHRKRAAKRREYRDAAADQSGMTFCGLFMTKRRSQEKGEDMANSSSKNTS